MKKGDKVLYVHGGGKEEEVKIREYHVEADAFTIFIPSLNRERQTTQSKLRRLGSSAVSPRAQKTERTSTGLAGGGSAAKSYAPPPPSLQAPSSQPKSGAAADWRGADALKESKEAGLSAGRAQVTAAAAPPVYSYHRELPQAAAASPCVSPWAARSWSSGKADGSYAEIVDGVFGSGTGTPGVRPKTVEEEAAMYTRMMQATVAYERAPETGSGSGGATHPGRGHPPLYQDAGPQQGYANPTGDQQHGSKPLADGYYSVPDDEAGAGSGAGYSVHSYRPPLNGPGGGRRGGSCGGGGGVGGGDGGFSMPSFNVASSAESGGDGVYRGGGGGLASSLLSGLRGGYGAVAGYRQLHSVPEDKAQAQDELEDIEPQAGHKEPVDVICDPAAYCSVS